MKHKINLIGLCTLLLVLIVFFYGHENFWIWFFLLILISLCITSFGAYKIQWNYFLKSIHAGKPLGIALTFDDGPEPATTPAILEILKKYQAKATFFVIGKKAVLYPELIHQIVEEGHTLANHSYSHSNWIGFFSEKKLQADISRNTELIKKLSGKQTRFFRPPFGVTNPKYRRILKSLNLISIAWTLRSYDTTISNKEKLVKRITNNLFPGTIILLHDNQNITLEALPDILKYCNTFGINIVNLADLIEQEPYAEN